MARLRLVYLVTEDWYFISHRLPMARAAREAGFEVHVATRVQDHGEAIAREGFNLHALDWSRTSRSPLRLIAEITAVRRLYSQLQPDIVHQVALKPVALGSLAGLGMDFATVNSIAGLGISSVANSLKAKMLGKGAIPVLRT